MRRTRAAAASIALATAVGLVGGTPAAADTQVTATTTVNIRSRPVTTAPVVGGLYRGQVVSAVSSTGGWTKIRFARSTAYIATRYLTKGTKLAAPASVAAGSVKITTTDLNLRKGPGLSYGVVVVLREGTRVTMTGKTARGFAEVYAGSRRGWVSTQYLANATSGLPSIIGTRVATADLDIRTSAAASAKVVGEIKRGTKVAITGAAQNGRAQIVWRAKVRWVTAKYLANPTVNRPRTPALPKVAGYRYATAVLNVRSNSSDKYTLVDEVPKGTRLAITGVTVNGRAQIIYRSAVRWVTAKYLSKTPPPVTRGSTGSTYAVEKGLQPKAIKVHRALRAQFPRITTYYGVRADPLPDHPSGRALDAMIPSYTSASGKALGYEVANYLRANAASLGVEYIIWRQHIWSVRRSSEGWRFMADRGGDSANHLNHVHVTVYGG